MSDRVVYRYAGDPDDPDGPRFAYAPRRDLTEADVEGWTPWQHANVLAKPPGGGEPAYVATDAAPETHDEPDPRTMTRADLNAYAAAHGIDDPEGYPNKDALLAALDKTPAEGEEG